MKSIITLSGFFVISLLVAGCAYVRSNNISPDIKTANLYSGGAYILPKTLIRLRVVEKVTRYCEGGEWTGPTGKETCPGIELDEIRKLYIDRSADCVTNEAARPVEGEGGDAAEPCVDDTFKVFRAPDPEHIYGLGYVASVLADDDLKIEITKEGYLSKITASADDKTGEILETAAQLFITIASGVPSTVEVPQAGALAQAAEIYPLEIPPQTIDDVVIDPLDRSKGSELLRLQQRIAARGGALTIERADKTSAGGVGSTPAGDCSRGICYRLPLPYLLKLTQNEGEADEIRSAYLVMIDHGSPMVHVDISRSSFVDRDTTLTFSEGVLTEAHIVKPSEGLAVISVPLTIANAVLNLPVRLLTFRTQSINADKALTEAQKKLILEQKAVLGEQVKLIDAQRALIEKQKEETSTEEGGDASVGNQ